MKYGSVCSGIEAATAAWHPLGWTPAWFAEIEAFPSAVLAHHYPQVTNHGDFTKIIDTAEGVDVLVGGTPCQAFSVAGLRQGLADPRGGLTLEFLRLARALRPKWIVWENVPGVLSQDGGRAFGAFLGGLEDLGYGWAYRVLDAQYFGLAQRRKRVFVVGCAGGDFARAAAVLLEPEGVRGNPPARREARQGPAGGAGGRAALGGGEVAFGCDLSQKAEGIAFSEELQPCIAGHSNHAGHGSHVLSVDLQNVSLGEDVAGTLDTTRPSRGGGQAVIALQDARGMDKKQNGKGWSEDGLAYTVDAVASQGVFCPAISPALKARDFKGPSSDGDGDGAPLVVCEPLPFDTTQVTSSTNRSNPQPGDPCHPLAAGGHPPAICYTGDGVVADPLSANEHKTYTHEGDNNFRLHNCVDQTPTLAFKAGQSAASWGGCATTEEFSPTLQAQNNGSTAVPAVMRPPGVVRRLTPTECERLQGFPDGFTRIPYRGKAAEDCPDAGRYKALGNSMAVPVMRWIGERIALAEALDQAPPAPAVPSAPSVPAWLQTWSGRQEQD